MHSSRMRTIRCSGRLSCHTHPLPCMPPCHAHLPCHACPSLLCTPPCHAYPPPVNRILDTCLWKHYLSTTTAADVIIWIYIESFAAWRHVLMKYCRISLVTVQQCTFSGVSSATDCMWTTNLIEVYSSSKNTEFLVFLFQFLHNWF